jgi:ABC-type lipoprotein export system ATPase subunit
VLVELSGIHKTYGRSAEAVHAVRGASLSIDTGEFVGLQGPSGCGKTTLLLVAGGLLHPDQGRVSIAGVQPYGLSSEGRAAFRAKTIGFVFQQFHLVPYLSVRDNVLAPALAGGGGDLSARTDELLERFGLAGRRHHVPNELSSGERQRTALARALLHRPKLILADEPTGNLDPENATLVLAALRECAAEGAAVLLVTHDRDAAAEADRSLRMNAGVLTSLPVKE